MEQILLSYPDLIPHYEFLGNKKSVKILKHGQ